jgi:thymidylate kinase
LSLAKEFADRFVVIDGARGVDAVSVDVRKAVDDHLAAH